MYSTRGRPRQVTDAQVQAILEWHRNHKPMRQFARELGLTRATIRHVIRSGGQYKQPSPEEREFASRTHSIPGRPRLVTDTQVQAILEWHRTYKPKRQFARELGLPKATISGVIGCGGQYKQASPEKRELAINTRRRRLKKLRDGYWM